MALQELGLARNVLRELGITKQGQQPCLDAPGGHGRRDALSCLPRLELLELELLIELELSPDHANAVAISDRHEAQVTLMSLGPQQAYLAGIPLPHPRLRRSSSRGRRVEADAVPSVEAKRRQELSKEPLRELVFARHAPAGRGTSRVCQGSSPRNSCSEAFRPSSRSNTSVRTRPGPPSTRSKSSGRSAAKSSITSG